MLKVIVLFSCIFSVVWSSPIQKRVLGGLPAAPGQFPYEVSFQIDGEHRCGGTIVTANTIITAAHCVYRHVVTLMTVLAGTNQLNSGGKIINVQKVHVYPRYNSNNVDNDIAIIILSEDLPVDTDPNIRTIPMVDENEELEGKNGTISGWGLHSRKEFIAIGGGKYLVENSKSDEFLRYVRVPIRPHIECEVPSLPLIFTVNMLCAGYNDGHAGFCQGDSGSPLVVDGKLAGIASWGGECKNPSGVDVYTNVAKVRSWIRQTIQV